MKHPNTIQVFEHEALCIGEQGFEAHHFDQLVLYNEKHYNQFFTVGHQKIFFKNYVGVIQVGDLVIEILPKADRGQLGKYHWRRALIHMLCACQYLRLQSLTEAHLQLRSASLVELYFESFLSEVEQLLHKGLVKQYRYTSNNLNKLKGRIQFSRQLQKNLIHKERFYTTHQVYDHDHLQNQILKRALRVMQGMIHNHHLYQEACKYELHFSRVTDTLITEEAFQSLHFNQKTNAYRYALNLARLILLQYTPDLKGGQNHLLAMLFDMNALFEQFIYLQLKKEEASYSHIDLQITAQESQIFWQNKTLRPDIVLSYRHNGRPQKMIIDTKWKILEDPTPSDHDLRQMYAYNLQFEADRSVLLYPKVNADNSPFHAFEKSALTPFDHHCKVYFVELFDGIGNLKDDIGASILRDLDVM